MPDYHGQLRLEADDLWWECGNIANLLDDSGLAACTFTANASRFEVVALEFMHLVPSVYGTPPEGNTPDHTLWIVDGAAYGFAWLTRRQLHVPDYLRGKFAPGGAKGKEGNLVDCTALATLINLVDTARTARPFGKAKEQIAQMWQQIPGRYDDGPAFLDDQPDQGGHDG